MVNEFIAFNLIMRTSFASKSFKLRELRSLRSLLNNDHIRRIELTKNRRRGMGSMMRSSKHLVRSQRASWTTEQPGMDCMAQEVEVEHAEEAEDDAIRPNFVTQARTRVMTDFL
jgi:hypothetical protein